MKRTTRFSLWALANVLATLIGAAAVPKLVNSAHPILGWGFALAVLSSVLKQSVDWTCSMSKAEEISDYLRDHGYEISHERLINLPNLDISGRSLSEIAALAKQNDFDEDQVVALLKDK